MRTKTIFTILAAIALIAAPATLAQVDYLGNLFITVQDDSGAAVNGAAVLLKGKDYSRQATTDADGEVSFIGVFPDVYELEVGASGFNTAIVEDVRIETLANPEMVVTLQRSELEERVVVTAETPLLDRRQRGTETVWTPEELDSIPTARDPWAILSTIPGVSTDRVNVAGNEAGQQSISVGKGDSGASATWVMDGMEFTDNAAEGATSSYLDFNSFSQVGFISGGADPEQASPGMRLNFVTKQGTNRHTGTIRMLFADRSLQENVPVIPNPDTVVDAGGPEEFAGNEINEVFEKNFDIGGPILKDKLWYWGAYTQNDIDVQTAGTPDRTKLQNVSVKVHGQATQGRTNYRAWVTEGDKVKDGRGASATRPSETTWDQGGPSPIYSGSVSHFFGSNLEVSAQWGRVEGQFALAPKGGVGEGTQMLLDSGGVWRNTFIDFSTKRPSEQTTLRANYFLDTGGWEHELKFGFRYKETERSSTSVYGGGDRVTGFEADASDCDPDGGGGTVGACTNVGGTLVPVGTASFYRDLNLADETEHINFWAGDTMIKGPWAINFGFNYSQQEGMQTSSTSPENPLLPDILPTLTTEAFDPGVDWEDILPRVGVTYTFPWENRLMLRGSYSQFVDFLGNTDVGFSSPAALAYYDFMWADVDGNQAVSLDELIDGGVNGFACDVLEPGSESLEASCADSLATFGTGFILAQNIDPSNPAAVSFTNQIDPDLDAPRVEELIFGAEYELAKNFTLAANVTLREREDDPWRPLYDVAAFDMGMAVPLTGSTYYDCGDTVSGMIPGTTTAYSEPICTLNSAGAALTNPAHGQLYTNRDGYTSEFQGLEIVATKRLSDRWMLRAFFSWGEWENDFSGEPTSSTFDDGGEYTFFIPGIDGDPTNWQGGKADNGGLVANQSGGSGGKDDVWLGSSRWQFNVNGLYQLPKGYTISANIQGREGYGIPFFHLEETVDFDGFVQDKFVQIASVDTARYDDLFLFDFKAAKSFRMEGETNVEVSLEVFNAFDEDTELQLGREVNSADVYRSVREVLSPRIYRFAATITF